MLPYIIAAGVGYLINEIVRSDDTKESETNEKDFWVFVRSDDFGKSTLEFSEYESAKKFYDKFSSNKKVSYQDIIDYDETERKFYDKWGGLPKIDEYGQIIGVR